MSFVSEGPAPGSQVDPKELTPSQLAALRVINTYKPNRVSNGWRSAGSPMVKLSTTQILGAKRLVIIRFINGRQIIETTGLGKNTLGVADERAERRKA